MTVDRHVPAVDSETVNLPDLSPNSYNLLKTYSRFIYNVYFMFSTYSSLLDLLSVGLNPPPIYSSD